MQVHNPGAIRDTDMSNIDTKEIAALKTEVSHVEAKANSLTVKSPEDYKSAADMLASLKTVGNAIKERKEKITKPLNDALRSARDLFRPLEDSFIAAESTIKTKMLDYKRKADEEARIKEQKIAERVERGTLKPETAERKIEQVTRLNTTEHGDVGAVQVRKVKKVRIVDPARVPHEFWVIDEVKVRKQALAGVEIPGVEVYEDEQIASSRSI